MRRHARGGYWWKGLLTPLYQVRYFKSASPSSGWKIMEEWFEPQGAVQQNLWPDKFEVLRMQKGGRPLDVDWTRRRCREHVCMPRHPQYRGYATFPRSMTRNAVLCSRRRDSLAMSSRKSFGIDLQKSGPQRRRVVTMLCPPALRVAAANRPIKQGSANKTGVNGGSRRGTTRNKGGRGGGGRGGGGGGVLNLSMAVVV